MGERTPDMPEDERRKVARQVGLGAMVYAMLSVDNNKDTVFDMDASLSFEGHTGPYIQNAYVRANSILKKSKVERSGSGTFELPEATFDYELSPHEVQLIDLMSRFPAVVEQAALEYRPLVVATYAYELANTFHSFYHAVPVLQTESETVKAARLQLVAAARQVLANALALLGITAPEVM
jgi:arginyl-tRNA synthetase